MGEKIVIGPINKGLRNDRTAFVINDDSFPNLVNAYQWRGRIKRKRGTSFCTHLNRYFDSTSLSYTTISSIVLDGSGSANLIADFSLETNGSLKPTTIVITDTTSGNVYTDPAGDGILVGAPAGSGTVNYASGAITIAGGAGNTIEAQSWYYPNLPVMGLEEFIRSSTQYPGTIAFDTRYSYNIINAFPFDNYDVSFFKTPPASASLPGYIQKTVVTPATWNGQDYQQFYTINNAGALWATNGVTNPFSVSNIGMQFVGITNIVIDAGGPPAIVTITTSSNHGLVVGDFVFINEVIGMTGINFQTGYVIAVPAANQIQVEFPLAVIAGAYGGGGIVQYLTNRFDPTLDCIRWYDGDPTNGSTITPVLNGNKGWVNFCPPLSQDNFDIADLPPAQYYLVGAKIIYAFKDRMLFIGAVVQTSSPGSAIYLPDTVVFSQNGTPYYTASFSGDPINPTTIQPMLVPTNQTAFPSAWWEDQTGFGGYITLALDEKINTASNNEDVLIFGLDTQQARFVYTGNDIIPFNFFLINAELGSSSTFSTINTDEGVITRGDRGFIITAQNQVRRIDIEIPDEVFQSNLQNNGSDRVTAQRDYINEWIYFTYNRNSADEITQKFPNTTLLYNYRDDSWSQFLESYTTYGIFRKISGFIWSTVGDYFPTWQEWNESWNAGSSTILQETIIAGNQVGFVVFRDDGTTESPSLPIQAISGTTITVPNHNLNEGDFIKITDCLGTVASTINNIPYQVTILTVDSFKILGPIPSGTYIGEGKVTRMYVPVIQSKQFPTAWGIARKTRLGPQQYLLSKTDDAQVTLLIYLSQNADSAYNDGNIVPEPNSKNDSLVYSTVLYTCPESTNLGLTPANSNLNMPTASQQQQIWHRINTSLIGDTVQFAISLSRNQMLDEDFNNQFAEIEFHSAILDVQPSQLLV